MKSVRIHRPGGHDRLLVEELPTPVPGPGEVRVATRAAGVNYADCVIRMGLYESAKKYVGYPITPGFEFSGEIDAVGPGADEASRAGGGTRPAMVVGTPVFGVTRFGGCATHVVVPAHQVFAQPPSLSFAQSAGFPTAFLTAAYALHALCRPREGQHALVHSAAGGVGSALLQLCRVAGIHTVGVVGSAAKVETAKALGATHVIDKSTEPLWERARELVPGGFDMVFDANGVTTLRQGYQHLRPTGRLVIYGFHSMLPRRGGRPEWLKLARDWLRMPRFNPLDMTGDNKSVLAFNLSYLFDESWMLAEAMTQLMGWLSEGKLTVPPVRTLPLSDVAEAHRALESAQTVGKLVLLT